MGCNADYFLTIVSDMNHDLGVDKAYTPQDFLRWCDANDLPMGSDLYSVIHESLVAGYVMQGMCWHDFADEMKAFTIAFPTILFKLEIEEEGGDEKSYVYFMEGKMQVCRAEITVNYPEFDPTKMA